MNHICFTKNFISLLIEQARLAKPMGRDGFVSVGEILSSKEYLTKKINDFNEYEEKKSEKNN
jgi:hypothetical protein